MNIEMLSGSACRWACSLAAGSILVMAPLSGAAQTAEERGRAIAVEADRRVRGYGDYSAHLTMVLTSRDGGERRREMRIRGLEQEGRGEKTLIVFEKPLDLAGVALLTFTQPEERDEQWLYLPALKRVKRLASGDRSGSFMGSEFAYEDVGSQEVANFSYRYLRDDTIADAAAFVVERRPLDRGSGYLRQVVWVDQAEYRPLRVDYYDRRGVLLKTLELDDYRQHAGAHWRAGRMIMTNHQTGRITRLVWTEFEFAIGLRERDFDPAALARVG